MSILKTAFSEIIQIIWQLYYLNVDTNVNLFSRNIYSKKQRPFQNHIPERREQHREVKLLGEAL